MGQPLCLRSQKNHSKGSETCLKLSDLQTIAAEEEDCLGDDNNTNEESPVSHPKETKKYKKSMSKEYLLTLMSEGATDLRLEIKVSSKAPVKSSTTLVALANHQSSQIL